jgi:hypothetical protein
MHDEIITEVYQIRDQLSEKYNHNLDNILKAMSKREKNPFSKLCKRKKSKTKADGVSSSI